MTPVFKSNSCHKYDTIDYYQVDPSFGTLEDLKELVQKAHERGMKVVMDAVFNHTAREFFAFEDILEKGEKSKYLDWYFIEGFPLEKWIRRDSKLQMLRLSWRNAKVKSEESWRLKNSLQMLHAIGSRNVILMAGDWM